MLKLKRKVSIAVLCVFVLGLLSIVPQTPYLGAETARAAVENYDIGNVLWEANIDSGAVTTFTQKDTIRGTTTYMVDPTASYGVSGNTEAAPSGADGNVLRFTHTKDNVNYATWVELARGTESNGIKPTGTNKVLITEARIFISSDIVDLMLMNYHMQDIYTLKKGFEYLTIPAAQRVGKSGKWILIKSVLDTSDGSYKIYFDGTELASGTVENLSSIQTKGMWPQLRAFANDPAVAANADLAASEYMLIDYFRVGEPSGTVVVPTPTPGPPATGNLLWEITFDNETERSLTGSEYKADYAYIYNNPSSDGASFAFEKNAADTTNANNIVAKLTHTKSRIASTTWVQRAAAVDKGLKPTAGNNIVITEARIYVSHGAMNIMFGNYYWGGSNIAKGMEQTAKAGNITPETWIICKSVFNIVSGEYKIYVGEDEVESGTVTNETALTALSTYGVYPQVRGYGWDAGYGAALTAGTQYVFIDYIKVYEPAPTNIKIDDISFWNGTSIEDDNPDDITLAGIPAAGGFISADVTLENTGEDGHAYVIVALFHKNEGGSFVLENCAISNGDVFENDTADLGGGFNVPAHTAGDYMIKVFVWGALDTMNPYDSPVVFNNTGIVP